MPIDGDERMSGIIGIIVSLTCVHSARIPLKRRRGVPKKMCGVRPEKEEQMPEKKKPTAAASVARKKAPPLQPARKRPARKKALVAKKPPKVMRGGDATAEAAPTCDSAGVIPSGSPAASWFDPTSQGNQYVSGMPFDATGTPSAMGGVLGSVVSATFGGPDAYKVQFELDVAKYGQQFGLAVGGGLGRKRRPATTAAARRKPAAAAAAKKKKTAPPKKKPAAKKKK
jgi:hypothetical protein